MLPRPMRGGRARAESRHDGLDENRLAADQH